MNYLLKSLIKKLFLLFLVFLFSACRNEEYKDRPMPNFILFFCDDLGYGDIEPFGSSKNRTPELNKMAEEGMKLTSFYVTASVCTPSRASLLTGCYTQRIDMAELRPEGFRSVLLPGAQKGLNPHEITLAEALKEKEYATACIGKWHVGDQPQFLPTRQGFDYYFGIPYSNDMEGRYGVPLMRNEEVIEQPVDQNTLTQRYTEEVLKFIEENRERPFFIYLPHTMPHAPLHASEKFRGRSDHGIYSDAVEEIDWSTGRILTYLRDTGLSGNTFVFFTSDNGGESRFGGVNDPLRGGKGTTWEGGMRVPAIAWWPGKIPGGTTTDAVASAMDLFPTYYELVYEGSFHERVIDGHNLWPLLSGEEKSSPYQAFFYYDRDQLQAVRSGKWKLHLPLKNRFKAHYTDEGFTIGAELYDLDKDMGETDNVAGEYPEVVEKLIQYAENARRVLGDEGELTNYIRPAGMVLERHILKKE